MFCIRCYRMRSVHVLVPMFRWCASLRFCDMYCCVKRMQVSAKACNPILVVTICILLCLASAVWFGLSLFRGQSSSSAGLCSSLVFFFLQWTVCLNNIVRTGSRCGARAVFWHVIRWCDGGSYFPCDLHPAYFPQFLFLWGSDLSTMTNCSC